MPPSTVTATVTVSPALPDRLYRTLLPKCSLTGRTANSPHGCPGPSTPPTNARATLAVRPARQASRSPEPPTQPSAHLPSRPLSCREIRRAGLVHRDARSTQQRMSSRKHTASAARPWPSVKADGAYRPSWRERRPSAMRPSYRACAQPGVSLQASPRSAADGSGTPTMSLGSLVGDRLSSDSE